MAFEPRDMTGSLFDNERKEKETHPDLNGSVRIDGKDYWLSGWKKIGPKGEWISLSAKLKEARKLPANKQSFAEQLDDGINF